MKPHGHGDVHYLLQHDGIVDSLLSQGFEYAFFLQDTNALVVHSILPALGVSYSQKYHMNRYFNVYSSEWMMSNGSLFLE